LATRDGRHPVVWAIFGLLAVIVIGGVAFALTTWGNVDRVEIERMTSIAEPPEVDAEENPDVTAVPEFRLPPVPSATDGIDTLLMAGSDSREGLEDLTGFGDFEGARADVLLLLIRPRNGDQVAVVSLPRDLWVSTPCGQERIGEALEGCAGMNGESTLLATVESLTGLGVDHLALVDMAGFRHVVDELGGYEICVERPVRDEKSKLDLSAGCHLADGEQTLAWLRSRTTEELTEDGWRLMSGVSDLTRNERQRDFLIEMLDRLGNFGDPQEALSAAQTLSPYVTVDSNLGITQAVSLAWTMRGLGDSVEEIEIPVEDYVTQSGAQVLLAAADIEAVIADVVAVETVGELDGRRTG
jgi:LCP family protein required for cell wall assembly